MQQSFSSLPTEEDIQMDAAHTTRGPPPPEGVHTSGAATGGSGAAGAGVWLELEDEPGFRHTKIEWNFKFKVHPTAGRGKAGRWVLVYADTHQPNKENARVQGTDLILPLPAWTEYRRLISLILALTTVESGCDFHPFVMLISRRRQRPAYANSQDWISLWNITCNNSLIKSQSMEAQLSVFPPSIHQEWRSSFCL